MTVRKIGLGRRDGYSLEAVKRLHEEERVKQEREALRGKDGKDGRNGRDGKNGKDGLNIQTVIKEVSVKGERGERGAKGERGSKGDRGDKGGQGDKGDDGISIVSADVDNRGDLIIKHSDGRVENAGHVQGRDGRNVSGGGGGARKYTDLQLENYLTIADSIPQITIIDDDYTVLSEDDVIKVTGARDVTVTLLTASGISGIIKDIKHSGTGELTIKFFGDELADDVPCLEISPALPGAYVNIKLQSDNENWMIM